MRFASVSELLDALVPQLPVEEPAWNDVLARAEALRAPRAENRRVAVRPWRSRLRLRSVKLPIRRGRRVLVVFCLLVLALVLFVAAAYALGYNVLLFSSAPNAPAAVVKDFSSFSVGAPPGMDPRAVSSDTRFLGQIGGRLLWASPTRSGGFCYEWSQGGGGCESQGALPLSVIWEQLRPQAGVPAQPWADANGVDGTVSLRWADAVELRLDDGSTVDPDVIWVSAPINAGFFSYRAPPDRTIRTVLALHSGQVVTAQGQGVPDNAHAFADLSKRQKLAEIETKHGPVVLWTASTKTDERCAWLTYQNREFPVSRCLPAAYAKQGGLGARGYLLGGHSILAGTCGYRALRLVHGNGSSRTIACTDGLVLADLTPADRAPGGLRALGAHGRVILSEPWFGPPMPRRSACIHEAVTRRGTLVQAIPVSGHGCRTK